MHEQFLELDSRGDDANDGESVEGEDEGDKPIRWSPSPSPQHTVQTSQVILVPNSDPSTKPTDSQHSQSQTRSEGQAQTQTQAMESVISDSQEVQEQDQPSSAPVPSHVSETAPPSSPVPAPVNEVEDSNEITSFPRRADDVLEDDVDRVPAANESVTASTSSVTASQSQSQPQSQSQQSHPPITVLTQDVREDETQDIREDDRDDLDKNMDVDNTTKSPPRPSNDIDNVKEQDVGTAEVDELAMDESDEETEAFLTTHSVKRSREAAQMTITTPDRKRIRRSEGSSSRRGPQMQDTASSPQRVQSTKFKARNVARAKKTIDRVGNNTPRTSVPTQAAHVFDSVRNYRLLNEDGDGRQRPPDLTLQNIKDILRRVGQARQSTQRQGAL